MKIEFKKIKVERSSYISFALALGFVLVPSCFADEIVGEKATKSLQALSMAIMQNPKNSAAYVERADFYAQANEDNKALADFEKAIKLDPKNGMAYYKRGDFYYQRGDFKTAKTNFEKAAEVMDGPMKGAGYRWAARMAMKQSQWAEALKILTRAIPAEAKEGRHLSVRERAKCNFELKKYKEALVDINDVLSIPLRHDDEMYALRAQILMKDGKYDAAIKDLSKALQESSLQRTSFNKAVFSNVNTHYYQMRAECFKKLGNAKLEQQDLAKAKASERDLIDFAPFR